MSSTIDKKVLHTIIGLGIIFGFWLLPEFAPITKYGWKILGLFIGTIYLWTFVDTVWPSFFAVLMYVITGYTNIGGALSAAFGSSIFWMLACIMAMFSVVNEIGLGERITVKLLTMKFLQGHPWRFTFVFFITLAILSNSAGGITAVFLLWNILSLIRRVCNLEKGNTYLHLMALGVAFLGAGSQCFLPFRNTMLLSMIAICGDAIGEINYTAFMAAGIPVWFAILIVYILMMKYLFRCDVSFMQDLNLDVINKDLGVMKKEEKVLSVLLLSWLVVLIIGSCSPAGSIIGKCFARIGGIYGATMLVFVLSSIWIINTQPLVSFQKAAGTIPWGMLLMIAIATSIGTPLMSQEAGIKAFLVANLTNVLTGHSVVLLIALAIFVSVILTNLANNMAIAMMFAPLFVAVNEVQSIPLMSILMLLTFSCNFAIVLPSASPVSAMLFANDELVIKSRHFKFAVITVVMGYIVLMCVGYPLASVLIG